MANWGGMVEINFDKEIQNLKTKLALENPYLLPLFFHLKIQKANSEANSDTPADTPAFTTGKEICFSDLFFEYNNDERYAILLHELAHNMLLHPFRKKKIIEQLSFEFKNYSLDAILEAVSFAEEVIVNDLVVKMGGELPKDAITKNSLPKKLKDFFIKEKPTTEALAKEILKIAPPKSKSKSDVVMVVGDATEIEKEEKELKKVLDKVLILSKTLNPKPGVEKGNWEEIIEGILKPQVDWNKVLKKKIQKELLIALNRSWRRIHKKKSALYDFDFILPNWDKSEVFNLLIAIDTSGSMSEIQLRRILSEVFAISSQSKIKAKIKVLMCDTDIQDVIELKTKSDIQKLRKIKGRGGTSYTSVFDYISSNLKNKEKATLVYFTDGLGNQEEEEFKEAFKNAEKKLNSVYWAITKEDKIDKVVEDLEICEV